MKLIVCLDDAGGMMFNCRRQSRDRVLIADVISHVGDSVLWVSPYSAPLFGEDCPTLRVSPNPFENAKKDDFCFVENTPLPPCLDGVDELIIYPNCKMDCHFHYMKMEHNQLLNVKSS